MKGVNKEIVEMMFTKDEFRLAKRICDKSATPNKELVEKIVEPVMKKIDEKTGQENHSGYWAYALEAYCKGLLE
jgi:hypothetical protein